ncbi:ABC transporter substrate-binding protein [Streptomyces sp. NPDC048275]|uniref:ABC transporter substrate-binding protein n=1 Tax=Streptomyces sp. NPDC048275 TaxID=3155629 RepID=UPI0033FF4FE7
MRGTVLDDRYTLTERIGAGGMGVVWRARDARLDRQVAVKLLSLPPGTGGAEQERLLAMFVREARAAAALDSSYIVPVFDHGTDGDVPYIVMPLLSGRTVLDLIAEAGQLPPGRAAQISAQVCRALETAHGAGIVHRDVKPANVMVTEEGLVKVLDFGIAKFLDATTGAGYLTRTSDSPVGTLHYMAPERFRRVADDSACDLYSLGCMIHEMLTGAPPFDAPSAAALMHCHVYETPDKPSVRRPGLAPRWDELVGLLLAKTPETRPTAHQARAALEELARSTGHPAPRPDTESAEVTSYRLAPPKPVAPPASWQPPRSQPAGTAEGTGAGAGAGAAGQGDSGRGRPRRTWWISGAAAVSVAALITAFTLVDPFGVGKDDDSGSNTGGSTGTSVGGKPGSVAEVARTQTLSLGSATDSKGPAPAVTGARKGGTVTVLEPDGLTTIDPGEMWSGTERLVSRLVYRSMTGLKTMPDGTVKLVGDLATDTGRVSSSGLTWTFTLKPGLTYNDGTPVRAQDFVHAVERTVDPDFVVGDGTLRSWILGTEQAAGIEDEPVFTPGTIEAPDNRTVVYHLRDVHPDFNVALAGPTGAPVPERVEGVTDGSQTMPSTGPYQVADYAGAQDLTLTRNPQWKADADPLRTAYPDTYRIEGNVTLDEIKSRTQQAGSDDAVMSFTGTLDKDGLGRAPGTGRLSAPAAFVHAYIINTARVKDLKVRRAIATALPTADVLAASGEDGTVATHLMAPGLSGSRTFDLYRPGAHGDPAKARALLKEAGKTGFRITLAYASTADGKRAAVVKSALEEAGFRVQTVNPDTSDYYDKAGSGEYDLFRFPVGSGLPVASTYLPNYFDGRYTYPTSQNYSRLKSDKVDAAIDEADAAQNLSDAGELWATVDHLVMEQAAAVPLYVPLRTFLYSTALHGLQVDLDGVSPLNAYVAE